MNTGYYFFKLFSCSFVFIDYALCEFDVRDFENAGRMQHCSSALFPDFLMVCLIRRAGPHSWAFLNTKV